MASLKKIIFLTLFINLLDIVILTDPPEVINTCGNILGRQPSSAEECIEEGEICCYVSLITPDNTPIKFCVSSPSDIDESDVKSEIEQYTGYEIKELKCNNSKIIKNSMAVLFILLFILF